MANNYTDIPAYADMSYDDGSMTADGMSGSQTGTTVQGTAIEVRILRMAWLIIILGLVALWLMGGIVFKNGK